MDDLLCLAILLLGGLIVAFWFKRLDRLRLRKINSKKYEAWIGGAPTILPNDDNPNPIEFHINENGVPEWYREID